MFAAQNWTGIVRSISESVAQKPLAVLEQWYDANGCDTYVSLSLSLSLSFPPNRGRGVGWDKLQLQARQWATACMHAHDDHAMIHAQ